MRVKNKGKKTTSKSRQELTSDKNQSTDIVEIVDVDIEEGSENSELPIVKSVEEMFGENLQLIDKFYGSLVDKKSTLSDKLDELVRAKTALLVPIMGPLLNKYESPFKAEAAKDVIDILDSLEKSLYDKAEFELREEIDFEHPKIQKAFIFIVEAVVETMKDLQYEQPAIEAFVTEFGFRMVGFEKELGKRMKGLSAQTLDKIENPLVGKYVKEKKLYEEFLEWKKEKTENNE